VILLLSKEFFLEIFGSFEVSLGCFPLKDASSLDGIIAYLTRKHGGNVHDKQIVTVLQSLLLHVTDFTFYSTSWSKDEPGQWVCWDFHGLRVNPTHYTIYSPHLKSWVIEGSLDGEAWIEIDQKTDNDDLAFNVEIGSFACSKWAECRFIRLTQTGTNHDGPNHLAVKAVEFFGTLLE
jgi:hypothetical protein